MADQIRPFPGPDLAAAVAHTTQPRGIEESTRPGSRAHGRPKGRASDELAERLLAGFDVLQDTHSQLFALLNRSQLVNDVLGVELVTFDSTAQIAREYRTQVGAVEVVNHSTTADVIVSSAPPTVQPGGGKGVYRVGAGQRQVVHIGSHCVTLYGTTGQQVSYTAFTKPQPPAGGFGAPLTGILAAQTNFTAPVAGGGASGLNTFPTRPGALLDVSATGAAGAAATATLPAAASVTTWITGFELTWDGTGTGAVNDVLTVTGPTNTLSYKFTTAAGVGGAIPAVEFPQPIPASAVNTAITVAVGATASRGGVAIVVHGFRL